MAEQVGVMSRCCKSLDGLSYSQFGRNLKVSTYYDDFDGDNTNKSRYWQTWTGGAGAQFVSGAGTFDRIGIASGDTGTTNAGYATIAMNVLGIVFGAGTYVIESDLNIPILSTIGEEFIFRFGFGDQANIDEVDGVYFEYDRLTSANWLSCTADNSVRTKFDTGIPVVAGIYLRLKIVINTLGTQANFYLNNILIATVITNIPTGVGRCCTPVYTIVKSAGVTSRIFVTDWCWLHYDLATSR